MPRRERAPLGAPCWMDLAVADEQAARSYYSTLLGWEDGEAAPEFGGYFQFFLDSAPVAGCMKVVGEMVPAERFTVYLAVADAEQTARRAAAAGGTIVVPPQPVGDLGTMGVLVDPTGASVGLWQPETFHGFGVVEEPGAPQWFELHTNDYDRALEFYSEVFSWQVATVADSPGYRYATPVDGEVKLAGVLDGGSSRDGAGSRWVVWIGVDDLAGALERLGPLGGSVVEPPQETEWSVAATVADPAGVPIRLMMAR